MAKRFRKSLVWIRRDLRLHDHAALAAATEQSDGVAVVFVFDTQILTHLKDRDDRRLTFIHRSLEEVDEKLRRVGSALIVRHGDPAVEIPRLAAEWEADAVFTARDYEPSARERDATVAKTLGEKGVAFETSKDSVIFEGGELLTQGGGPFRVYTPYSKAWLRRFEPARDAAEHRVRHLALVPTADLPCPFSLEAFGLGKLGFESTPLWLEPGEKAAKKRLDAFESRLADYPDARNYPAQAATSGISAHLRFGTVSIRECVRRALAAGPAGHGWLRELIWRDFFQDVLFHHPHVVERPFREEYADIVYPGEDSHFEAWKEGRTGYPLVDAAMRHFNATGWMHNRLRMVCASFLTKDLLIDYRRGEGYFARYLLDFDLASNNGNWQWAASTGCDAQPYFRIFNPVSQSEKFDPEGVFIRQNVPELAELSNKAIHFPSAASAMELAAAGVKLGETYPEPVVDHAKQRERAIELLARKGKP